jgi:hypothetical protein
MTTSAIVWPPDLTGAPAGAAVSVEEGDDMEEYSFGALSRS